MSRSRFKRDRLSGGYLPYSLLIGEDDFVNLVSDGRGGVAANHNGEPISLVEAKKFFTDLGLRTTADEAPIVGAAFTE